MPSQHKIIINATSNPCQFRILNFNWSILKKKNRIKNKKHINLDLTSSSSRTQKSSTQKIKHKEHKKICKSNEMKSKKDLKLGFKLLMLVSSGNEHYIFNSLLHRTINCTKREMKNKTKSITYTKIQKKWERLERKI